MAFKPSHNYSSNSQYEQTILAMISRDTDSIFKHGLHADLFYNAQNKELFRCIESIARKNNSKKVTQGEIVHLAQTKKRLDVVGGEEYVEKITSQSHSDLYNETAVKAVKDVYRQRVVSEGIENIRSNTAGKTEDELRIFVNDQIAHMFKDCSTVSTARSASSLMDEILAEYQAYQDTGKNNGMNLGIPALDNFLQGVQPCYFVIGALSSVGKTSLAVLIWWNLLKQGYKVPFFSQEMSAKEILHKVITIESAVGIGSTSSTIMGGNELSRIRKLAPQIKAIIDDNSEIFDDSLMTIEDVRAKCYAFQRKHGRIDAIALDYIQNIDSANRFDSSFARVTYVSKQLKGIGKDLKCTVLALSQLTPDAANIEPTPMMLRDSKQIMQDADIIGLIHRLQHRNERPDGKDLIQFNFAKGRSKGEAKVNLLFDTKFITFDTPLPSDIHSTENPFTPEDSIVHKPAAKKGRK